MLFFPDRCALCAAPGASPCHACANRLRPPPLLARPEGVDRLVALFSYEGEGRRLIGALKYRNRRGAVTWFGDELAARFHALDLDCVTWIPSSRAGIRDRGFDTGQLIARRVGRVLRLPSRRLLTRNRGDRQTGHSAQERAQGPDLSARPAAFSMTRVLIVDDVCTTGASISAAADLLRKCGAKGICAGVAARTPVVRPGHTF